MAVSTVPKDLLAGKAGPSTPGASKPPKPLPSTVVNLGAQLTPEAVTSPVIKSILDLPNPAKDQPKSEPTIGEVWGYLTFELPAELASRLIKPPTGQGGWQNVIKDLQKGIKLEDGIGLITLTPTQIGKLIPLSVSYGGGGYQGAIRWLLCLAMQAKGGI